MRHFGKMSSYAYMKNRQTRVSLAMRVAVMLSGYQLLVDNRDQWLPPNTLTA